MNVGELIKMLEKYPKDMEVIHEMYSDYAAISEDEWNVVDAVPNSGGWLMRAHPTMSEENKEVQKKCLCLDGN